MIFKNQLADQYGRGELTFALNNIEDNTYDENDFEDIMIIKHV